MRHDADSRLRQPSRSVCLGSGQGAVKLAFTVSGERGEWVVRVTGEVTTTENETVEKSWFPLWSEMIATAGQAIRRKRSATRPEVMP